MNRTKLLVYFDKNTNRMVRYVEHDTIPANLNSLFWMLIDADESQVNLIKDNNIHSIMHSNHGLVVSVVQVTELAENQFRVLSRQADCLEQLSKITNLRRINTNTSMPGNSELISEYLLEINNYNKTKIAGPLLISLVESESDVAVGIAEFTIKYQTYINFLIESEVIFNTWSRKIKTTTNLEEVLTEIRGTTGIRIK